MSIPYSDVNWEDLYREDDDVARFSQVVPPWFTYARIKSAERYKNSTYLKK